MSRHMKIIQLYRHYIEEKKLLNELIKTSKKIRHNNFPSIVSEHMASRVLMNQWRLTDKEIFRPEYGDLAVKISPNITKRIEVKCFSSNGPITFGPDEPWNYLVLIDARKCMQNEFLVYLVNYANDSRTIKNLKVNKTQTFGLQCNQRRRPHISPTSLFNQLGDKVKLLCKGTFEKLMK